MNAKTKKRLVVVSGIIILVLIVVLAYVGGNTAATTVSVSQAMSGDYVDKKVQVSGNVVENSFSTQGNTLSFEIYDPENDAAQKLSVVYDGAAAATFGNDVTAICTGKIDSSGVLYAAELVTKCPSKYENASGALSVAQMLGYGDEILNKPVKVAGIVKDGTLTSAGKGDRFVLVDADDGSEVAVVYEGALPDTVQEGTALVITGSSGEDSKLHATNVALEG